MYESKSERNRQILVNNTWRYFKAECKKLLEEKEGSIYRKRISTYEGNKEPRLTLAWHSWR